MTQAVAPCGNYPRCSLPEFSASIKVPTTINVELNPKVAPGAAERYAKIDKGRGLIDAVGRLDVKSVKLQARVGIATGLVVLGDLIGGRCSTWKDSPIILQT
jgi:class 3 adenylate cyclase